MVSQISPIAKLPGSVKIQTAAQKTMEAMIYESGSYNKHEHDSREHVRRQKSLMCSSTFLGISTGFFVEVATLGAYIILNTWEDKAPESTRGIDMILYLLLSLLSHLDTIFYTIAWGAFTCSLTRPGTKYIRARFDIDESKDSFWTGRVLFITSVSFLGGVAIGSFIGWTLALVASEGQVPWMKFVSILLGDLILCVIMVWCYDFGHPKLCEEEKKLTDKFFFV